MSDTMLGRGADAAFATRKPCKHGSLICFTCEPLKGAAAQTNSLDRAIAYLGAVEVAPGRYALRMQDFWATMDAETTRWLADSCQRYLGTRDPNALDDTEALYDAWATLQTRAVKMPSWWKPERRYAWRINGETFADYRALKEAYPRRVPSGSVQRITADLSTGKEIPA